MPIQLLNLYQQIFLTQRMFLDLYLGRCQSHSKNLQETIAIDSFYSVIMSTNQVEKIAKKCNKCTNPRPKAKTALVI